MRGILYLHTAPGSGRRPRRAAPRPRAARTPAAGARGPVTRAPGTRGAAPADVMPAAETGDGTPAVETRGVTTPTWVNPAPGTRGVIPAGVIPRGATPTAATPVAGTPAEAPRCATPLPVTFCVAVAPALRRCCGTTTFRPLTRPSWSIAVTLTGPLSTTRPWCSRRPAPPFRWGRCRAFATCFSHRTLLTMQAFCAAAEEKKQRIQITRVPPPPPSTASAIVQITKQEIVSRDAHSGIHTSPVPKGSQVLDRGADVSVQLRRRNSPVNAGTSSLILTILSVKSAASSESDSENGSSEPWFRNHPRIMSIPKTVSSILGTKVPLT